VEPLVARIERVGDQVRVASPRRVESTLTEAVDLAWADADTLAVLGTSGASSLEVLLLDVGSSRLRRVGAPEEAATLAAAPSRPVLIGAAGVIYRSSGSTWTKITEGQYPVYPG
jgi:hypothetical protein